MCSNMDGPNDYQTKWSRLERERQISYHLYAESKIWNKLTYLQNRNRHTDIEKRIVVAKEEESCRVMNLEFDINRCKLWYIEKINNKIPSYQWDRKHSFPAEKNHVVPGRSPCCSPQREQPALFFVPLLSSKWSLGMSNETHMVCN